MTSTFVLDQLKRNQINDLLEKGQRYDGRRFDEPRPPGEDVIELARVVDRGIRESGMVDLSQLVLEKDKTVIGIFADNSVTDHDGNLFDACSCASTAAILT